MLLDPVRPERVCTERPVIVEKSATFVVNITKLAHPDDVKRDSYGKWHYSGSRRVPFHATLDPHGVSHVERCCPGATGDNVFYLRRLYSFHPSNSSFRRVIAIVTGEP